MLLAVAAREVAVPERERRPADDRCAGRAAPGAEHAFAGHAEIEGERDPERRQRESHHQHGELVELLAVVSLLDEPVP